MRLCYSCDTPSGIQNNSIITIDQENKKPHVVAAALRHPNMLMLEPRLTTPTREAWSLALLMCCAGAIRNTILRCLHHRPGFLEAVKTRPLATALLQTFLNDSWLYLSRTAARRDTHAKFATKYGASPLTWLGGPELSMFTTFRKTHLRSFLV